MKACQKRLLEKMVTKLNKKVIQKTFLTLKVICPVRLDDGYSSHKTSSRCLKEW